MKYPPQVADESSRRCLFVATGRASRSVFIRIFKARTAANARRFLRDLECACPLRIRSVLTDSGKEVADRLFGLRKPAATRAHEVGHALRKPQDQAPSHPDEIAQDQWTMERVNGGT